MTYLERWVENFTNTASGLMIERCFALYLNITKYDPIKGSSYILLPKELANKKAIVNVQNDDNRCLAWALQSALHPVEIHAERTNNYKDYKLNMDGIDFPTPLSQIRKDENKNNLAINVYGHENKIIHTTSHKATQQESFFFT